MATESDFAGAWAASLGPLVRFLAASDLVLPFGVVEKGTPLRRVPYLPKERVEIVEPLEGPHEGTRFRAAVEHVEEVPA